jgi:predicted MFS family arabinose efflux permease
MAFVAVFAAIGLGRFGYSAILPSMREELGLSGAVAGSLASWNQVGYTVMVLVGGILASRFGARIVVGVGLVVTAGGMLLTGVAGGLVVASTGRVVTGLGNAMVLAPSIALMAAWFEPRRLGTASGLVPAGSSFALIMVGPVVPRIIEAGGGDGWRWAWYFFAAATLFIAVLAIVITRDRPYEQRHVARSHLRWKDLTGIMRSRRAWFLGSLYFCYGFAFLLFFTYFQARLGDLGYSAETAGVLFLVLGAGGTLAMLWGRVSDSIGRGRPLAAVLGLQAVCALVFALWDNIAALGIGAGLFGLCGLSVPGLFGAACGDHFGSRRAAASLGFVTAFMRVGQTIGPYVGGALEDAFGSLTPSYLVSAGVFVVGATAALFLRDRHPAAMQPVHTTKAS